MRQDKEVLKEKRRIMKLFADIPEDKRKLLDGLFVQAARLRLRLDDLWNDIQSYGETEMFSQSEKTDPYERERPAARLFTATDKNYQSIMKQLTDALPDGAARNSAAAELAEFMKR